MISFENMTDTELVFVAIVTGRARWEPFTGFPTKTPSGELCFNGLRYATELDENFQPVLGQSVVTLC